LKPNKRLDNVTTTNDTIFVKSKLVDDVSTVPLKPLPGFLPSDLLGRSYINLPTEDGQRFRMRIVKTITDHHENLNKNVRDLKFLVSGRNKTMDEILTYNEIIEHLQRSNAEEEDVNNQYLKFRSIIGHQGPLSPKDPLYKGSSYNVLVDWEDGETTYEPLDIIAADDPITCALYAKNNELLEQPGWKRFKRLGRREVKLTRLVNQARLRSVRRTMRYQYGFLVPNTHAEAVELDRTNGNTKW